MICYPGKLCSSWSWQPNLLLYAFNCFLVFHAEREPSRGLMSMSNVRLPTMEVMGVEVVVPWTRQGIPWRRIAKTVSSDTMVRIEINIIFQVPSIRQRVVQNHGWPLMLGLLMKVVQHISLVGKKELLKY